MAWESLGELERTWESLESLGESGKAWEILREPGKAADDARERPEGEREKQLYNIQCGISPWVFLFS